MRPILYPRGQTIFSGNGIGILSDVISCKCTEVLNGMDEVELRAPKDGNHVEDISVNCIIKVKPNYDDSPQPFRIYSVEQDIEGLVVAKAAHLSYDTSGIPILPFMAENLSEAVDNLNTNRKLVRDTKFVLNANFSADGVLKVTSPSSFRALLGGNENTIANVYGGEYHYDDYVVELLQRRGVDKGICFRYGKNITDFEQEENSEELYSAVFGFWKKSGSGDTPDTFVYGDIIEVENVLPYDKIYVLDTSDKIKNEDESDPTVDQINDYVRQYIASTAIGIPNYTMKISYAEDDNIIKVCLGDTVGVVFPDYGINTKARCSKVVFDCLLERNESIEIGVISTGIGDAVANVSNASYSVEGRFASDFHGHNYNVSRLSETVWEVYNAVPSMAIDSCYGLGASIVSDSNIDDFKTPGVYTARTAAVSSTLINSPSSQHPFRLSVLQITPEPGVEVIQRAEIADGIPTVKIRHYAGSSWGEWQTFMFVTVSSQS